MIDARSSHRDVACLTRKRFEYNWEPTTFLTSATAVPNGVKDWHIQAQLIKNALLVSVESRRQDIDLLLRQELKDVVLALPSIVIVAAFFIEVALNGTFVREVLEHFGARVALFGEAERAHIRELTTETTVDVQLSECSILFLSHVSGLSLPNVDQIGAVVACHHGRADVAQRQLCKRGLRLCRVTRIEEDKDRNVEDGKRAEQVRQQLHGHEEHTRSKVELLR